MIAGLESITEGDVMIDGKRVNDEPPRNRDIAMVFQDYALYPHKSLYDNMAFGLRLRKTPEDEIKRRVMDAARLLRIDHMLDRKPAALSGGQRQRVAIGRAIVRQPKVFLFDEPLSNLDAQLRNEMRSEIKKLHQRLGATIIYVTHDQVEAMTLADRIAVLSGGHKMQYASPNDIYNRPAAQFVAGFTGSPPMNLVLIWGRGCILACQRTCWLAQPASRVMSSASDQKTCRSPHARYRARCRCRLKWSSLNPWGLRPWLPSKSERSKWWLGAQPVSRPRRVRPKRCTLNHRPFICFANLPVRRCEALASSLCFVSPFHFNP
jgi:ABC-type sugar transport system ATPase subunit